MLTLLVSSQGWIVLPARLRRRLGIRAGAKIEVLKKPDGQKLRVIWSVTTGNVSSLAGMAQGASV